MKEAWELPSDMQRRDQSPQRWSLGQEKKKGKKIKLQQTQLLLDTQQNFITVRTVNLNDGLFEKEYSGKLWEPFRRASDSNDMSSAYVALAQDGLHEPCWFFPALWICMQNRSLS